MGYEHILNSAFNPPKRGAHGTNVWFENNISKT